MNVFRDGFADAGDPLQLAKTGPGDRSRRPEMVQQCPLASRSDPRDLIERRTAERLCPLGTVRADRKPMCLVAQALEKVKHGVPWIERKWRSARQKEALAPSVAVGPFCYRTDRDVVNAELIKNALRNIELSQAAVDKHEIGPDTPIAFRIFPERPRKAALQHLAHHRVIVAASNRLPTLTHPARSLSSGRAPRGPVVAGSPLSRIAGEGVERSEAGEGKAT